MGLNFADPAQYLRGYQSILRMLTRTNYQGFRGLQPGSTYMSYQMYLVIGSSPTAFLRLSGVASVSTGRSSSMFRGNSMPSLDDILAPLEGNNRQADTKKSARIDPVSFTIEDFSSKNVQKSIIYKARMTDLTGLSGTESMLSFGGAGPVGPRQLRPVVPRGPVRRAELVVRLGQPAADAAPLPVDLLRAGELRQGHLLVG